MHTQLRIGKAIPDLVVSGEVGIIHLVSLARFVATC